LLNLICSFWSQVRLTPGRLVTVAGTELKMKSIDPKINLSLGQFRVQYLHTTNLTSTFSKVVQKVPVSVSGQVWNFLIRGTRLQHKYRN